MITFPLSETSSLVILEPGNIQRLKSGKPLKVGEHLVCFTPDMDKFLRALGVNASMPKASHPPEEFVCKLTPEQIDSALKSCQNLKEVYR